MNQFNQLFFKKKEKKEKIFGVKEMTKFYSSLPKL